MKASLFLYTPAARYGSLGLISRSWENTYWKVNKTQYRYSWVVLNTPTQQYAQIGRHYILEYMYSTTEKLRFIYKAIVLYLISDIR
jgi:hypothetical protein